MACTEICGHEPGCLPLWEGLTKEHRWLHYGDMLMSGAGFVQRVVRGVNKSQSIGLLCTERLVQHHISCRVPTQHWRDAKWVNPCSNCMYILSFRLQYHIHVFFYLLFKDLLHGVFRPETSQLLLVTSHSSNSLDVLSTS